MALSLLAAMVILVLPTGALSFPDRAIGVTLFSGVDPWYRNRVYALAVIAALALLLAVFLRLSANRRDRLIPAETTRGIPLLLVSLVALNGLLALLVTAPAPFAVASVLTVIVLVLRVIYASVSPGVSDPEFVLRISASWQLLSCLALWTGWFGSALFLLLWFSLNLYLLRASIPAALGNWMLLSPLVLFLAAEISHGTGWPSSVYFLLISVGIVGWSSVTARGPRIGVNGAALSVLVTTVIVNEYSPEIIYRQAYDLFHLGERVLPLQQWQSFGLLPFVDYLPVHGLFDLVPQIFYQTLFGASALESQVWGSGYFFGWVMRALAMWISWEFFRRLLRPEPAFFLLWLLPTYHLIEPYYALLLLPAIHVFSRHVRVSPLRWWLLQWLMTAALFLWRPDFGLAVTMANLSLSLIAAWYRANWSVLWVALSVGLFTAAVMLSIFLVAAGFDEGLAKLRVIVAYLQFQVPVASYTQIYESFDFAALMQYVVLPALTIAAAAWCLARLALRQSVGLALKLDFLVVFLSAMTLVLSIRALQRHSLLEGLFQHYFYLLVLLLFALRYLLARRDSVSFHATVAMVVVLLYLAVPTVDNRFMQALYRHQPQWEYPLLSTGRDWPKLQPATTRLLDATTGHQGLVAYLRKQLADDETFYEFTNAHMLYALADVQVPVYVTQTIYQSSDTVQLATREQLQRWHDADRLPLVVFRQNTVWDRADGIDNALRSYLLAEFIYRHYRPCVGVDQFEVWLDRRRLEADYCSGSVEIPAAVTRSLVDEPVQQFIDFGQLPRLWAFADGSIKSLESGQSLGLALLEDNRWRLSGLPRSPCEACYLDLTIDSPQAGRLALFFNGEERASLQLSQGVQHYRVRLSALWYWHAAEDIETFSLEASDAFNLREARLTVLVVP